MHVRISRLAFKSLRNSEYTMFISQLVAIFLKYDADALQLRKSFDRVVALTPELDKIRAQDLSSAYSNMIRDLDVQRDNLFSTFVSMVKTLEKSGIKSLAPHVEILKRLLDKHGRDIAEAGYSAETKRLNDFLVDISTNANVMAAITATNLALFIDQLRTVNTEFASKFMVRVEESSMSEIINTHTIRRVSDKTLVSFFDAIEFCSSEYEELDYVTPAKELNELITYYKTMLKGRESRRIAGKDISVEAPIDPKP
ncbi:MAG: hypothetical protein JZU53_01020 [Paludibacter sp.]|nr:hypothetical protein [Paludibacter sp.]